MHNASHFIQYIFFTRNAFLKRVYIHPLQFENIYLIYIYTFSFIIKKIDGRDVYIHIERNLKMIFCYCVREK